MGIYIKGVEMPTCCDKCIFKAYVGADHLECKITGYRFYVWEVGWGDGTEKPYIRHESCPLIELHPHGRLIDADALEENAQKRLLMCDKNDNQFQKPYEVMRAIALAPTIIEADYPPSVPLEQVWTELFGEDGE